MNPIGITRVRNEELIIEDTIRHFLGHCEAIIMYDDCSTDRTVEIAMETGKESIIVIHGDEWKKDRVAENTRHRKLLLEAARNIDAEWVLCFDADERLIGSLPIGYADGYTIKLFDGYLTDCRSAEFNGLYLENLPRMWGPEYRSILMLFRADKAHYDRPGMRAPRVEGVIDHWSGAVVKHYGKCLSVEHWEETCDYYINHFPKSFQDRWRPRKGKAIHTKSDFGRPLYTWKELMNWGGHTDWVKI